MPMMLYVLALYGVMALILTYPLVTVIGRAVSDPVDPLLNMWIMAWGHHALLTDPLNLFNANIFYPHTKTLLFSETLLLPSLVLLPVSVATGNPILSYNLMVLAGFVTTGFCGYLLGRWLFRGHLPGILLGMVVAFNSYTLSNVSQVQLLHYGWLLLSLLYLGKLLRRAQIRSGLLFAFLMAAQFYTVVYYGLFGFLLVGIVGGVGWLLSQYPTARERWYALSLFIASVALAILLCLPLALAYYRVSVERGFERTLVDAWPFSASIEMWVAARPQSLFYGELFGRVDLPRLGFYQVDSLFPGIALLVAAGCGLGLWLMQGTGRLGSPGPDGTRHRGVLYPLFLLLGIGLFFVLSLGPYPQIKTLQPDFELTLPYAWVHEWLPGFKALRAPGRFALIAMLGLGVASAYWLKQMRWRPLQLCMLALLLLEVISMPVEALYFPTIEGDRLAVNAWLATQPKTVYLELPIEHFGAGESDRWLQSQFGSISHWQQTPVGYSGFFPDRHEELLHFLSLFPSENVVTYLAALGVEWIVVDPARISQDQWHTIQSKAKEESWETHTWGEIWALRLPSHETLPPEVRFAIPDRAQSGSQVLVAAIFTHEATTAVLPDHKLGEVRAVWWLEGESVLAVKKRYQPPFIVDRVAVAMVPIPAPHDEGTFTLQLYDVHSDRLLTTSEVHVLADVEVLAGALLPVEGLYAVFLCDESVLTIEIMMSTIGWFDEPFTLSARIVDEQGTELMRSGADVEFAAEYPRTVLRSNHPYRLPLSDDTLPEVGTLQVDLVAYQWQQDTERIVPRHFIRQDGTVVEQLRLPLMGDPSCP